MHIKLALIGGGGHRLVGTDAPGALQLQSPGYPALNPSGLVPALRDGAFLQPCGCGEAAPDAPR